MRSNSRLLRVLLLSAFLPFNQTLWADESGCAQTYSALVFSGAHARQLGITSLQEGVPVEREMKGGETHSYQVPLITGQFLNAVVSQQGIDVVATLIDASGHQIVRVDSPNSMHGPEPVVLIAEATGNYRLDVTSSGRSAPGRYEIRIVEQRQATISDSKLVTAHRAFQEAQQLRRQGTAVAFRSAIDKLDQALQFFHSTHDYYWEALSAYSSSTLHARLSNYRKALNYAERSLPLFRGIPDKYMEAFSLNLLGGLHDSLGDLPVAQGYYHEALALFRVLRDQAQEGAALNNIGKIDVDLADWQNGLDNYTQALSIFRTAKDKPREGLVLHNIGVVYNLLGEFDKGLEFLEQALTLRREVGDKSGESYTLFVIAYVYRQLGKPQKTLEYLNQSLPLRKAVGDINGEAYDLNATSLAYADLNALDKALDYGEQALQKMRSVEDRRGEAVILNNLGHVYILLKQPEKSIDYYRQSLAIFGTIKDKRGLSNSLLGMARAERQRGSFAASSKSVEEAISLIEQVRAGVDTNQQLRTSYLASNQDAYHFYIDLLMQQNQTSPGEDLTGLALQINERSHARNLLGMLLESRVDVRQGVDAKLIERERMLELSIDTKAERLIQLNGQKNKDEQIAELDKELSALEDQYQQVQVAIRKASPAYAALTQPQPLGLKEVQAQLDQGTMLLEYSLGEERSYVWAVTQNSLKTYELPKREQIEKAARLLYGLLTARSQSKAGEDARTKQERIVLADSQLLNATKELSQMVLGPIGSELGANRLVIVADGALQYVPFAALSAVSGQVSVAQGSRANNGPLTVYRPLIRDHEIISLPSVSALAVQRQGLRNRKPAPNAVAVIADPVFSPADERLGALAKTGAAKQLQGDGSANTRIIEHLADDSGLVIRRLKFTRQEADQILAEAPRAKSFRAIDFKANRATATGGELSRYRYVHFATHGYIDSERPDLSAIVLSLVDEEGKPQDGFLRANEIYNLNLPAELVVLSACETGLGKEIKGEGLVGLTQGFMYAGARRVVVSLWNVNDRATAELMARFYRGMLRENKTPAAALRAAQVEMSRQRQWQSPYYWAAFVLQGEWK